MGTDIHYVVQKRTKAGWRNVTRTRRDHSTWAANKFQGNCPVVKGEFDYIINRNYYLFAWLADVRQDGFSPVKPVTSHRGLPKGFKQGYYSKRKEDIIGNDVGEHSQGWALASEILKHPRPPITYRGIIDEAQYIALRDEGINPTSWCGGIAGAGIRVMSDEEYEAASYVQELPPRPYIRTSWTEPDVQLDGFIAAVKALADKYGSRNVRLVFGFDS